MLIVEFADSNLAKGTTNPPDRQQPCSEDEALGIWMLPAILIVAPSNDSFWHPSDELITIERVG
jgi:hypothetical protein